MKKLLFLSFCLAANLAFSQVHSAKNLITNGEATQRIDLQSFILASDEEKINLQWVAAVASTGKFTIEKSKDAVNFTKVIDVPSIGAGNGYMDYTEADYKPYKGTSYYRLKQTDKDGSYKYSIILAANFAPRKNIALYPNPLPDATNLNISLSGYDNEQVTVVLRDAKGNEFISKVLLTKATEDIFMLNEAKTLQPGTYIVTAACNDKVYNYTLMVK